MAYQVKRSKRIIEGFELVDENNCVVEHLEVKLNAGDIIEKIRYNYVKLLRIQKETSMLQISSSNKEEMLSAYEKLGKAVIEIVETVFGMEDTKKILDFYENDYTEMAQEVLPFITKVVIPKMNELVKKNKKELLSRYERRAQRRIGKGMRK